MLNWLIKTGPYFLLAKGIPLILKLYLYTGTTGREHDSQPHHSAIHLWNKVSSLYHSTALVSSTLVVSTGVSTLVVLLILSVSSLSSRNSSDNPCIRLVKRGRRLVSSNLCSASIITCKGNT